MDKTLTAKLLPAALICKGFITGMADCDYEIYLREIVNASAHFKGKSSGKRRQKIHIQYDGIGFISWEELAKKETA